MAEDKTHSYSFIMNWCSSRKPLNHWSDLCQIHHHPTPPQRTNLIPEPDRQHTQIHLHKTKNIPFDGPGMKALDVTEGYASVGKTPKIHLWGCCWCLTTQIVEKMRDDLGIHPYSLSEGKLWCRCLWICGGGKRWLASGREILLKAHGWITWQLSWPKQLLSPSAPPLTCCCSPSLSCSVSLHCFAALCTI